MNHKLENPSKIFTYLLALFFFAVPLDYVLPHIGSATVLTPLGLIIAAMAAFMLFTRGNLQVDKDQLSIVFLIIVTVISALWAEDTDKAFSNGFSFVATALMYCLLFSFKFSKDEIKLFEKASIVGGFIFILYVFTQVDLDLVRAGYRLDLDTVGNKDHFSDPNGLAARLIMPMVFMLKNIFENPKKRNKFICIAGVAAAVYIIFLTGSRASVITLGALFVIILLHYGGNRAGVALALLLLAVVVALYIPNLLPEHIYERIFSADKYNEVTTIKGDRVDIWKNVLFKVFPDAPILGHGTGNSSVALKEYYGAVKGVHNSWLVVLGDLGLLGFVPWMLFVFGKIKQAFSLRKKSIYVLAVLAGVIIMATTLESSREKYLWNGFLYVHLYLTMYEPEPQKPVNSLQ